MGTRMINTRVVLTRRGMDGNRVKNACKLHEMNTILLTKGGRCNQGASKRHC